MEGASRGHFVFNDVTISLIVEDNVADVTAMAVAIVAGFLQPWELLKVPKAGKRLEARRGEGEKLKSDLFRRLDVSFSLFL
jgi:hypothetical protein